MLVVKREQRQKMGEPAFVDRTVAHVREFNLAVVVTGVGLDDDPAVGLERHQLRHGARVGR